MRGRLHGREASVLDRSDARPAAAFCTVLYGLVLAACTNPAALAKQSRSEILLTYEGRIDCPATVTPLEAFDLRCPVPDFEGFPPRKLIALQSLSQRYRDDHAVCSDFDAIDGELAKISATANPEDHRIPGVLDALFLRGKMRMYCEREGGEVFVQSALDQGFNIDNALLLD